MESDQSKWSALPGPQMMALTSPADILFYGGQAGGGKTDLLLGLAHTKHNKSIIFRRENKQLRGIEDRAYELFKIKRDLGDYNRSDKIWRFYDGRIIELAGCELEIDKEKYQGRPHDLKAFDEITHFTRSQFVYITTWTRSVEEGQRCRIICTGNPPTSAEGDWVIDFWGPWLDERHPNPALPGELRWYTNIDGKEIEVPHGEPFEHNGEIIRPKSRTFIPASIDDNPYLRDSGYKATLQSLPRELREKFLEGRFSSSREDHEWQVIPSAWVMQAQQRWLQREKPTRPLDKIGADVSRGGADQTILTSLTGNYFHEQVIYPGAATPDGPVAAGYIIALLSSQGDASTEINIDVIGVGSSVYDYCYSIAKLNAYPLNSSETTDNLDRTGQLSFFNNRAEWWWKLREALDPETGDEIALPPDRELLADLTAPRWSLTVRGIQIEKKDDIKKRIGRSPDKGDSLVYALARPSSPIAFTSF